MYISGEAGEGTKQEAAILPYIKSSYPSYTFLQPIMSMKNSNDTIGNRFRDLPVCSAVPQPLRHRVPQHDVMAKA
jgi:hypothetical protein